MLLLEDHAKPAVKCHSWLYNNLKGDKKSVNQENYSIFKDYAKISFEEYSDALKRQEFNNNTHLIQFPPNFLLLTPKPISFDLVFNYFQYPDLTEQVKKLMSWKMVFWLQLSLLILLKRIMFRFFTLTMNLGKRNLSIL